MQRKKIIENALPYGRLWRYDCSKEPEQRKSSKLIINTATNGMLLHKAVKNNPLQHIINSKGNSSVYVDMTAEMKYGS